MPSSKPALFAAIVETIRNARRVGRDQRLLRAMSERELRDLGVGRSEIPGLMLASGCTQVSDAAAPRSGPRSHARCGADGGPAARP
ncbi:DUF1127 domain-containing protein [Variovorax sp. J22R115]|uniref:DUF1127 domain-containing protein n=1 Tax=Variovorax sp. J22R115 TaxID=3053509 RepID=UPI0025756CC0|nr:DUF1127 domain-containing protein [Variovorax sp. J22R115]MDM0053132.1 DUF1127 domain-containing protein [Variovorax sp. J22R115]